MTKWIKEAIISVKMVRRWVNGTYLALTAAYLGCAFANSIYWLMIVWVAACYSYLLVMMYRIRRRKERFERDLNSFLEQK